MTQPLYVKHIWRPGKASCLIRDHAPVLRGKAGPCGNYLTINPPTFVMTQAQRANGRRQSDKCKAEKVSLGELPKSLTLIKFL